MKKRYILVPAALCFCGGLLGSALMIYPAVESAMHDIHVQDNFASMSPEEQQACAQGILERKCAMCHTSKAKAIPILDSLSGGLLTADIKGAQRSLLLEGCADTRESQIDLLKMNRVLDTKRMPPAQYTIAHWGSILSDADITALRALYPADKATAAMYQSIAAAPEPSAEQALKIELGHKLYFDTRLSTDNTISCASCHDLTKGGTDNSEKSAGVFKDGKAQYGGVNAPTVFNAAGHIRQFWDGRAKDLKEQAGGPPLNPVEMGYSSPEDWKLIGDKLAQDSQLVALFQSVYGEQGITGDTITDAIAAFEETLCTPNSPFDRYLAGDPNAMSAEQIKGMKTFQDAGCITCHSGASLGGHSFEYINTFADMRSISPNSQDDGARGRVEFTKDEAHSDMFRVPTLRNVALTGPYFHTGKVEKLELAVSIMFLTQQSEVVMAEDIENVTSFLQAQTGEYKGKPLDQLTAQDVAPAAPAAPEAPAVTETPAAPEAPAVTETPAAP